MGQAEILEIFGKNPKKEFLNKEIAEILGIQTSNSGRSLKRLFEQGLLTRKQIKVGVTYCYSYKLK